MPDKSKFFSSLKDSGVNEKEYKKAVNVWKVFKIKYLGEYHDLYFKKDVLWLVDVVEKFVDAIWDAMLKITRIKLELISDVDMHLFIEKGMRGSFSYISKRHSKVDENNKFIMYWDENNFMVGQ